jgi:hypothetical protein
VAVACARSTAACAVDLDGRIRVTPRSGAAAALGFVLLAGATALTIRHRGRVILP